MDVVAADLLPGLRRARDRIDRHFAEPLDLDALAATAGLSKFHFLRCFAAVYGRTPGVHLTERRVERAQDLLRATTTTVTEVCRAVGYEGLGTFSRRFRELVGESPSQYRERWAAAGPVRVPGCWVFMHGLRDRRPPVPTDAARSEKPPRSPAAGG